MSRRISLLELVCLLTLFSLMAKGQSILITQPLTVTATCPGSTLAVPFSFTGSYSTSTVFTVQLSDGGEYKDVITKDINFIYNRTISVTIPIDLPSDRTYSVRIRMTNPDLMGTSSPTRLYLKGKELKPAPPSVDSLTLTCEGFSSFDYDRHIDLPVRLSSGATPRLYFETKTDQFTESATYPLCGNPASDSVECKRLAYMTVYKNYYNAPTFIYPVDEKTYYLSQLVDGCESDRVPTKVRILWRPRGAPAPANQNKYPDIDSHYGNLTYCVGQKAYPLNINGHGAPPENYQVFYYDYTNFPYAQFFPTNGTLIPPTPDTHVPGVYRYAFSLVPIDSQKGCSLIAGLSPDATIYALTYLRVLVSDPQLSKPMTTTDIINYLQGEPSAPLSATSTDYTASLLWYGTNAVGSIGSTEAPKPATNVPGQFTYYVSQKTDSCESDRVGITVHIDPLLEINDPGLSDAVAIYPNPVSSAFTVHIRGLTGSAQLALMNLTGQILFRREVQQEKTLLPMDRYPSGNYLLLINVGDRRAFRRIVKL